MLPQRPIHPFPARMASSIPWGILESDHRKHVIVLDPMVGSGTVPMIARTLGHTGIGFDVDPLAVLIASSWCADVNEQRLLTAAERVVRRSEDWVNVPLEESYPANADAKTKQFLRYWFDARSRRQLVRLGAEIARVTDRSLRQLLWCAFSRLIIVKQAGASRAMDVAHSRPHRTYASARIQPLEHFCRAARHIAKAAPFKVNAQRRPQASIHSGDARTLPLSAGAVDYVITSPPYLNAIDYLRGHRLSLVWMGHSVETIRQIRTESVGTEAGAGRTPQEADIRRAYAACVGDANLTASNAAMLVRFLDDMRRVFREIHRVLKPSGRAVLVIGNCNVGGTFVENSAGLKSLARSAGFRVVRSQSRELPQNRRYLPPPESDDAGAVLGKRMREEVILTVAPV
jgi:hypothetical protein